MRFQATCVGVPQPLVEALSSRNFARQILKNVVGKHFKVEEPLDRPADYHLMPAEVGVNPHPPEHDTVAAVVMNVTGTTRRTFHPAQYEEARKELLLILTILVGEKMLVGDACDVACRFDVSGSDSYCHRSVTERVIGTSRTL